VIEYGKGDMRVDIPRLRRVAGRVHFDLGMRSSRLGKVLYLVINRYRVV
jgi:hypothetical protein